MTTQGGSLATAIHRLRELKDRSSRWLQHTETGIDVGLWLMAAAGIAVISLIAREPILTLIAIGLALVAVITRVWWDNAPRSLTFERAVSQDRAFHGDTVTVDLIATNAKPLPLARIEFTDHVTGNVEILNRKVDLSDSPNQRQFKNVFSLGMYERVHYSFRVTCKSRGWHRFGPATAYASDPLGLSVRQIKVDSTARFLVYPRVVPITDLIVEARQPFGDFRPRQSVIEDPMRFAGVREYVAGDNPRRVHWRATARTGVMQTRVYEPSASPVAAVFLDTITFSYLWEGQNSALLELAVCTAASLCSQLLKGKHQVGLYANAPIPGKSRTVRVPPGRRPGQYVRILEDLAALMPAFGDRIEQMVLQEMPRLPWGATVVIVTCRVTEGLQRSLLRHVRSSGASRFVVVAIGVQPTLLPEFRKRVPVFHLSDAESWETIEAITMTRQA